MRRFLLFAALCLAAPSAWSQATISAPPGWNAQPKRGAVTFSPPDLGAGEIYSVTVYDSANMKGRSFEEYLRGFAGRVGQGVGQLDKPLEIKVTQNRIVSGVGIYNGPGGKQLGALFVGVSLDGGANIHVARTLFSGQTTLSRYQEATKALTSALVERAKAEAGDNLDQTPREVFSKLQTLGGPFKPGVYAGNQYRNGTELMVRYRVYLYPTGEYRLCNDQDHDLSRRFFDELVGNYKYSPVTGKMDIDWTADLGWYSDLNWCYYGRDAQGRPAIYANGSNGISSTSAFLVYDGPPLKRLSKSQEEQAKAAAQAEANRFKWVVKPGQGVANSQIHTVLCNTQFNGQSATTDVYLLLKDGSVYADLPVAPDELDVQKSKQKEPDKWGKWRKGVKGNYLVSWNGGTYEALPGAHVLPAPSQTKLQGRYGTGSSSGLVGMNSSYALWGVTFTPNGRFKKDSQGGSLSMGLPDVNGYTPMVSSGYDDNGSYAGASGAGYAVSSETKKKNPNGNREGDYSLSGYVLTLRYDNGKVARLPFFFVGPDRKTIYFEGSTMSKD